MILLVSIAVVAVLLGAEHAFTSFRLSALRRAGRYPQRGRATTGDVEKLLNMGSRGLAVRCYREIYGCSLREASDVVRALLAAQKITDHITSKR